MSTERYNARETEPHWQRVWDERGIFRTAPEGSGQPKYYVLEMFPYPSGRIHMGHVRNYAMGDVVARYKRAKGFDVLHPMGWDAFGLPAENAARDSGRSPAAWTYANIATMRGQLKSMGLSLDWSREVATCDPAYYRHQQRLFLDFLARGSRRPQAGQGELGPGRHDRARQRAGDRRPRLAVRGARRAARADAVVPAHRPLRRGPARRPRHARPLAGEGQAHAAQLDRPLGRPAVRFALAAERAGADEVEVYTTRPDTLFGARSWPSPPITRWRRAAAARDATLAGFIAEMPLARHLRRGDRDGGEAGLRHRPRRRPPVRPGLAAARLRRQLRADGLRHRRHLRLPGARPARPRLRHAIWPRLAPVVCPPDADPATFAGRTRPSTATG